MKKKFYYWANDINENSGEGILGNNFLFLLKKKYPSFKMINLNRYKKRHTFFYNYITPFLSLPYLHFYNLKGYKTSYINYLPIWNFLLILLMPQKTLLGPITGSDLKKNFLYIFFKFLGIAVLKIKYKYLLFSHEQFKKFFKYNKNIKYNFLLFNFNNKITVLKKYDFIFYLRKHNNKGNFFLIQLIDYFSKYFTIAIIGDYLDNFKNKKNIFFFGNISRSKARKIISRSKFAVGTRENLFSFFTLDCLSYYLDVFYNKNFKINKSIKTNLLHSINFDNPKKAISKVRYILSKKRKKYIYLKKENFLNYLDKS